MTRAEIAERYGITDDGMIEALGKFEGEMCYAPYFYDRIQNGEGVEEENDEGGVSVTYFDVSDEDRSQFPELEDMARVRCFEVDQGFFYCLDATEDIPIMEANDEDA
jgi:hypothetical protein